MHKVAWNVEKSCFQKNIFFKEFGKPKSQHLSPHPLVLVLLFITFNITI